MKELLRLMHLHAGAGVTVSIRIRYEDHGNATEYLA
jgi:hypothetical protein